MVRFGFIILFFMRFWLIFLKVIRFGLFFCKLGEVWKVVVEVEKIIYIKVFSRALVYMFIVGNKIGIGRGI